MSSKHRVNALYRENILRRRGPIIEKEIKDKVGYELFSIKRDLLGDKDLPSLIRLAESSRRMYIMAVIAQLEIDGKICRNGQAYYFANAATRKAAKRKSTTPKT